MEDASESYLELCEKSQQRVNQKAVQTALHFSGMADRYQEVEEAAKDTFQWIFDDSSQQLKSNRDLVLPFKDWLSDGDGIFHISGKPGSGKSTLMKFLCNHRRTQSALEAWAGDKELVVGRFFFWSRGNQLQKSLLGLIRGLMCHVVSQSPDIIPDIFPQHWDPARYDAWGHGPVVALENDEILQAFHRLVAAQEIYENYRYCFFIDGLDEFDESLQTHTRLINSLWSWVKTSQGHLKICVSSRELPAFQQRLDPHQRLRLQDLTKDDLVSVVQQTIRQEQGVAGHSEDRLKTLEEAILAKADGVFLWVVLTLKTVCESLQSGESIVDVLRILDTIPNQLEDLFRYTLDSIPQAFRRKAAFIFAFALGVECLPIAEWDYTSASEDLWAMLSPSLFRYSFLDDFADDPDFAVRHGDNLVPGPGLIQNRIDACRIRISGRCRGLLEFRPYGLDSSCETRQDIVRFTHRSIPEFLERYMCLSKDWSEALRDFEIVHAYSSTLIAALKLSTIDSGMETGYHIGAELLCTLQLLREAGRRDNHIAFGYLDELERALYVKQLAVSPEFPALGWTRFHSTAGRAPAFHSVFHMALKFHKYEYVAWRVRHDRSLVAKNDGNDAEAIIDIIKGIQFRDVDPNEWFPRSTPSDVFQTTHLVLNHGADPISPSRREEEEECSAWSLLLTILSKSDGDNQDPKQLYWAAMEAMLHFTSALPQWVRASESAITLSFPGLPHIIDIEGTKFYSGEMDIYKIPHQLRRVGGTATLEDWISYHQPENSERLLQILAAKEDGGVKNTALSSS
jgi:hypothetical protein